MQRLSILLCISLILSITAKAQHAVTAANEFIALLDSNEKAETLFPFIGEERYNFHFIPKERKGITFNEMNAAQKEAAFRLMKSCLGDEALRKTKEIMQMEILLKAIEERKPEDHFRDPGNYHITIFGIPANNTIWGWRFEGHHVSFNFSVDQQKLVAGTPGFLGSNPGVVLSGPQKGKEILKDETALGFALLHSLSAAQLEEAIMDTTAPGDIFTFNKRQALLDRPAGIMYSSLTPAQQQKMLQLINLYIHRFTKLFADDMLKEIVQYGLENLRFAWAGYTEPGIGKATYYRIQGPTLVIEYDNSQNNANHIHSVVRDLKHDFGGDELLEHYLSSHPAVSH